MYFLHFVDKLVRKLGNTNYSQPSKGPGVFSWTPNGPFNLTIALGIITPKRTKGNHMYFHILHTKKLIVINVGKVASLRIA